MKQIFEEIEVDVPDEGIDRAHRIGKKYIKNGRQEQAMIVKFTSWRYRTAVYQARKKASNKFIQLDLTSRRAGLLKSAKMKAEDHENIAFVFVDVNCNLGLKKSNGTFKFFNSDSHWRRIPSKLKRGNYFGLNIIMKNNNFREMFDTSPKTIILDGLIPWKI